MDHILDVRSDLDVPARPSYVVSTSIMDALNASLRAYSIYW